MHYWVTRNMNETERNEFEFTLTLPPPGVELNDADMGVWSRQAELAAFGIDLSQLEGSPDAVAG